MGPASKQKRAARQKHFNPFEQDRRGKGSFPWKKAVLAIGILVIVIVGASVVFTTFFRDRMCRRARLNWARSAVEDVRALVDDTTVLEAELGPLQRAVGSRTQKYPTWYNERIIVTADGKWIAYSQICSKRDWRIRDLFIGYSSEGRWYFSTCHFCNDMIAFGMCHEYPPLTLEDLLKGWKFSEFDGVAENCVDAPQQQLDLEFIQNNEDAAMQYRQDYVKSQASPPPRVPSATAD